MHIKMLPFILVLCSSPLLATTKLVVSAHTALHLPLLSVQTVPSLVNSDICKSLVSQPCILLPSFASFVADPARNATALGISNVSSSQVPRDNECRKISV